MKMNKKSEFIALIQTPGYEDFISENIRKRKTAKHTGIEMMLGEKFAKFQEYSGIRLIEEKYPQFTGRYGDLGEAAFLQTTGLIDELSDEDFEAMMLLTHDRKECQKLMFIFSIEVAKQFLIICESRTAEEIQIKNFTTLMSTCLKNDNRFKRLRAEFEVNPSQVVDEAAVLVDLLSVFKMASTQKNIKFDFTLFLDNLISTLFECGESLTKQKLEEAISDLKVLFV